MKYRFLEEIALADTAFEAFGKDEKELFENAALAVSEVMCETKKLKADGKKEIELQAENLEQLLHRFLSELVYLKDAEQLVFSKFRVQIKKEKNKYTLKAQIVGQKIPETGEQVMKTDVKAITWHQFGIQKTKKGFTATVILDV